MAGELVPCRHEDDPIGGVGQDRYTSAPAEAASTNFLSGAWRACEDLVGLWPGGPGVPPHPQSPAGYWARSRGGQGSRGPPLEVQPGGGGQTPGGPPALYPAPNGASHPRPQPITAGPLWSQPLVGYPPKFAKQHIFL